MRSYKELRLPESGTSSFARLWNTLLTRLDENRIRVASPLRMDSDGTGNMIHMPRAKGSNSSKLSSLKIWKPYIGEPVDPDDPQPEDWRTVRVVRGLVNNIYPDDTTDPDDLNNDGTDIILSANHIHHFWIEVTVSVALDGDEGEVTAVKIDHDTSWWTGHPNEPNGNSTTGAPPSKFYIDLYSIDVGVDSPATISGNRNPDYHRITFPRIWSANNYWVDEVSFGSPNMAGDGCAIQHRMRLGIA